jgi:hypothetical protein
MKFLNTLGFILAPRFKQTVLGEHPRQTERGYKSHQKREDGLKGKHE